MSKLTAKQSLFIQEYLVDLNATQAAIRAGYILKECEKCSSYYVYALIDPRNEEIFYIGKGKGDRFNAHEREWKSGKLINAQKCNKIAEIYASGKMVTKVFLANELEEKQAYSIENQFIKNIGINNLSNLSPGYVNETEQAKEWAKYWLMKTKPFQEWAKETHHSRYEVKMYFLTIVAMTEVLFGKSFPKARDVIEEHFLRTGGLQTNG